MSLLVLVFLLGCSGRMEQLDVIDQGNKEIGDGIYLKKLDVGNGDRVYLLVDQENNLLSSNTSTSRTIYVHNTRIVKSSGVLSR